jgi:hypothetical protein
MILQRDLSRIGNNPSRSTDAARPSRRSRMTFTGGSRTRDLDDAI